MSGTVITPGDPVHLLHWYSNDDNDPEGLRLVGVHATVAGAEAAAQTMMTEDYSESDPLTLDQRVRDPSGAEVTGASTGWGTFTLTTLVLEP